MNQTTNLITDDDPSSHIQRHWPITSRAINARSSVARDILSYSGRSNMISFAGGLPDPTLFPSISTLKAQQELLQYGPSEGEQNLRSWISEHLSEKGLTVNPDHIIVTSGSQQGLDLAAKLLINKGTPIITESPTYLTALSAFRLMEAKIHGLPLFENRIKASSLVNTLEKEHPSMVYLNPTYQNPSTACWSKEAREETAEILDRFDSVLVEDTPYSDLSYGYSSAPKPICCYLKKASWMLLGTFSKIAMPGLRIGYIACSPDLHEHILKLKQSVDLHTDRIAQAYTYNFVNSPYFEKHLRKLRHTYARKRNLMHQCLRYELSNYATWQIPEGGLFFWLHLNQAIDTKELLKKTVANGVAFMPGHDFFPDDPLHCQYFRLNFSGIMPREIKYGITVLANHIREAAN